MAEKIQNTVAFEQLPERVQKAVKEILFHNNQFHTFLFRSGLPVGIGVSFVFSVLLKDAIEIAKKRDIIIGSSLLAGIMGIYATALVRQHSERFRQEYLKLFHALKSEKNNPAIAALLKQPYLFVDKNKNLVGAKTAKSIFRIPLGRRRIINPAAKKEEIKNWKDKYLPKKRKNRHRLLRLIHGR